MSGPQVVPTTAADDAAATADADAAEGAAYALALLQRMRAGGGSPAELADLVQFLASGSMLHAACTVFYAAIRTAVRVTHDDRRSAR